jgi:hypothetical protein
MNSEKKLAQAKKRLEEDEKTGKIRDKTELENRKKKINEADQKLEKLRHEVEREKEKV